MLAVPWSTRFHGPGLEDGPGALAEALGAAPDRIDLPFDIAPVDALRDGLPQIADAVAAMDDERPVVLLGECTLAPAIAAGMRRRVGANALVWLDAHGDLNTPETTPSGFLGGMPFAILLGWCFDDLRTATGLDPPVPVGDAALVGARDLDPGERDAIARTGLVSAGSCAEALARLGELPVWVHLDGDVLDPGVAPGADFPAPGGWSGGRLLDECRTLAATGRIAGISVCCGNPRRDPERRGFAVLAEAVRVLAG
jgi:arginase